MSRILICYNKNNITSVFYLNKLSGLRNLDMINFFFFFMGRFIFIYITFKILTIYL